MEILIGFALLVLVLGIIKAFFIHFWDNVIIAAVVLVIIYACMPSAHSSEWVWDAWTGSGGQMHNSWFDSMSAKDAARRRYEGRRRVIVAPPDPIPLSGIYQTGTWKLPKN